MALVPQALEPHSLRPGPPSAACTAHVLCGGHQVMSSASEQCLGPSSSQGAQSFFDQQIPSWFLTMMSLPFRLMILVVNHVFHPWDRRVSSVDNAQGPPETKQHDLFPRAGTTVSLSLVFLCSISFKQLTCTIVFSLQCTPNKFQENGSLKKS